MKLIDNELRFLKEYFLCINHFNFFDPWTYVQICVHWFKREETLGTIAIWQ